MVLVFQVTNDFDSQTTQYSSIIEAADVLLRVSDTEFHNYLTKTLVLQVLAFHAFCPCDLQRISAGKLELGDLQLEFLMGIAFEAISKMLKLSERIIVSGDCRLSEFASLPQWLPPISCYIRLCGTHKSSSPGDSDSFRQKSLFPFLRILFKCKNLRDQFTDGLPTLLALYKEPFECFYFCLVCIIVVGEFQLDTKTIAHVLIGVLRSERCVDDLILNGPIIKVWLDPLTRQDDCNLVASIISKQKDIAKDTLATVGELLESILVGGHKLPAAFFNAGSKMCGELKRLLDDRPLNLSIRVPSDSDNSEDDNEGLTVRRVESLSKENEKLLVEYIKNPVLFGRSSAIRSMKERKQLLNRLGLSHEQIEGWAVMLDRNVSSSQTFSTNSF